MLAGVGNFSLVMPDSMNMNTVQNMHPVRKEAVAANPLLPAWRAKVALTPVCSARHIPEKMVNATPRT
jgi:hypothetical protein